MVIWLLPALLLGAATGERIVPLQFNIGPTELLLLIPYFLVVLILVLVVLLLIKKLLAKEERH